MKDQLRVESKNKAVERFGEYWTIRNDMKYEERLEADEAYCSELSPFLSIDIADLENGHLNSILSALYSAKNGQIIGTHFSDMISVAHLIFERRPGFAGLFTKSMMHYGGWSALLEKDSNRGKLKKKIERQVEGHKSGDPKYQRNHNFDELFLLLFPELKHCLY